MTESKTKGKQAAGEAGISTVRIVPDYTQLSECEKVEMDEACGEVRDEANALHNEAIGLARHIKRPSHMLKREALERYLRQISLRAERLQAALMRLPYMPAVLVLAACLLLPGCGSSRAESDAAPAPSSAPACIGGQCRAK